MFLKQVIQTENAPKPSGPYSQGVKSGAFIFVSGQDGGTSAGETIAEQTAASLENIKHILAEKDATLADVVYVSCHLFDLTSENVQEFNYVYESYFKNVDVKPARITVGSQLLGVKVEITAIASVS
ncbi:Rid family hydrolase [Lentibacillus sp. Marseille-P4043]|uniref:Rid family hydrolase n=1 Tax=Lentibacillus sp. Marseille-P4043 TaxID=2040293 RepID=UPI001F41E9FF|nr:Rid family hydrolase [Lentibacillus sp. Marseille-P4043]